MSRSHGAGQPRFMRCAKCRREWPGAYYDYGFTVESTGRRRERFTGSGGARVDSKYQYEYQCCDCGHIGWSRHVTMRKLFEKRILV